MFVVQTKEGLRHELRKTKRELKITRVEARKIIDDLKYDVQVKDKMIERLSEELAGYRLANDKIKKEGY